MVLVRSLGYPLSLSPKKDGLSQPEGKEMLKAPSRVEKIAKYVAPAFQRERGANGL